MNYNKTLEEIGFIYCCDCNRWREAEPMKGFCRRDHRQTDADDGCAIKSLQNNRSYIIIDNVKGG